MKFSVPQNYKSKLSVYDTQVAIGYLKKSFENYLSLLLNVKRVSAPLFVEVGNGLNDNLSGVERPVSFDILHIDKNAEIVHSLAKWKRMALAKYNFYPGNGLYTDMNAIRRDEEVDNIHSIYVDQWDWEKVIGEKDRTIAYLKETVQAIIKAMYLTNLDLHRKFSDLTYEFKDEVTFVTSEELLQMYPNKSAKERERAFVKEHGNTFLIGIGGKLSNGEAHDLRSPDYDDWAMNGDILVYNPVLDDVLELSSMGIRVNKESLLKQLKLDNKEDRTKLMFHQMLLNDELPLTIGGGIGESRLSMLFLEKCHIGEVQVSIWDSETLNKAKENNINIL